MFRNFNNYDVREDGRIWSKVSKKFLKPYTMKNGYQMVSLYDYNGKKHSERLHKVVFCAVNGLWNIPEGYEIHHIDECTTNNQISNLLLCSHKENCNFGTRNSRVAKAQSKRVGAFKDGDLVMCFPSTAEAGRIGYDHSAVSKCCRGKKKTYKGYEWRYLEDDE